MVHAKICKLSYLYLIVFDYVIDASFMDCLRKRSFGQFKV